MKSDPVLIGESDSDFSVIGHYFYGKGVAGELLADFSGRAVCSFHSFISYLSGHL